jgi:cytoskeleton protein RodZ
MSLADDSPLTFSSATEIGFALQQHREKKQISLDVAAGELRLSPRQVANLEAGQFADFRSAVFVKGYLRTCAKMYGLDGDVLVRAYERVAPQIEAPPNSPVTKARRVVISAPSQTKKYWVVAAALLLIAAAGAAYWQWMLRENVMVATPASETVPGQVDLPDIGVVGSVVGGVEPPAIPVTAVAPAALPVPAVEVSQDAVLHMEFSDDCWVQIKDESGKILHEKNQRKGDVLDMTVSPPLRVWLGRAGAANVSYNGVLVAVPVKVGYQSAQFVLGDDTQSDRVE